MKNLSVVTVTLNNALGLDKTLCSISQLLHKPYEVIVIDGKSTDNTVEIVSKYIKKLQLIFISEKDNGIYYAMNKGLSRASGDLIHYLNAGDCVVGEPYLDIRSPCLLPVKLIDKQGKIIGYARKTIAGRSYCHQGIIFPAQHEQYNPSYSISADFLCILNCFSSLSALPECNDGEVVYNLSGISSTKRWLRDRQIAYILIQKRRYLLFCYFFFYAFIKYIIPKSVRRWFIYIS